MSGESAEYVLRFHRPAGGGDGPGTARGLRVRTDLDGAGGFRTSYDESADGPEASVQLSFQTNADNSLFFENGTLTFPGDPAGTLTFISAGAGVVDTVPDPDGFIHGTVGYVVQSGTGRFAGATGRITSNFRVNTDTSELYDTHVGSLRLA